MASSVEKYLHDVGLAVDHRLDEDGISETAFADDLELAILLHFLAGYL